MKKLGLILSLALLTQVFGAAFASADTLTTTNTAVTSYSTASSLSVAPQLQPPQPNF